MSGDYTLPARRDVTTCLRLNTKNRFKQKMQPQWLVKVAPNHCFQPPAVSSAGVTPPELERTHTQQVLHVTFSFPFSPWVICYRWCHRYSYATPELCSGCCMPCGDVELPSPGYDGLQLGHTNCLNHINTPSLQVQKPLVFSLTWKLLKPVTVLPLQQWPLSNS